MNTHWQTTCKQALCPLFTSTRMSCSEDILQVILSYGQAPFHLRFIDFYFLTCRRAISHNLHAIHHMNYVMHRLMSFYQHVMDYPSLWTCNEWPRIEKRKFLLSSLRITERECRSDAGNGTKDKYWRASFYFLHLCTFLFISDPFLSVLLRDPKTRELTRTCLRSYVRKAPGVETPWDQQERLFFRKVYVRLFGKDRAYCALFL